MVIPLLPVRSDGAGFPVVRTLLVALVTLALFPPTTADAASLQIDIGDGLSQPEVVVQTGDTVTWMNFDATRHRVRARSGPVEFDSGNLEPGQSFAFTFAGAGIYDYVDDRDRDNDAYHGTITVVAPEPGDPTSPGGPSDPGGAPGPTPPSGGDSTPAPSATDVSILNRTFRPGTIEVAVGARVTWVNGDDRAHTVTARDGSWDSGIFDTGGTYSRVFDAAGSFSYICLLHPDMVGTVVVSGEGPAGDLSPAPEPPSDPFDPNAPASGDPGTGAPGSGRDQPAAGSPPGPSRSDVSIVDFAFSPRRLTISSGDSVTWRNVGNIPHTVTAENGSFDSGFLMSGDTFTRRFATPGTFQYLCTIHPSMQATVVVTASGSPGDAASGTTDPDPVLDLDGVEPDPLGAPGDQPSAPVGVDGDASVSIFDLEFMPALMTVPVGTTVSWQNDGALPHTVTGESNGFDSGVLTSGDRFELEFDEVGTFSYICVIHPSMAGTIVVTATDADGALAPVTAGEDGPNVEQAPVPEVRSGVPSPRAIETVGSPGHRPAGQDLAVALILAGGILASMAIFVFGMIRFGKAAAAAR